MNEKIETANDCLVCASGGGVGILMPPAGVMPKDKALRLAAWLVVMADPVGDDFQAVLDAVRNT